MTFWPILLICPKGSYQSTIINVYYNWLLPCAVSITLFTQTPWFNGENNDILFPKISQVISRTTGPNIGLFVLILMYFSCWFQIWAQFIIFENITLYLKTHWTKHSHAGTHFDALSMPISNTSTIILAILEILTIDKL